MEEKSIPVMVDDRKNIGEFMMTRAAYFYVEAIESPTDLPIDHNSLTIPLLPLEFSGVLYKPLGEGEYFETPDLIEKLYQEVELYKSFYVDSDNIWIPNTLFNKRPERSEIYRVPFDLFIKLYSLCRDDTSPNAAISRLSDKSDLIRFSEVETIAFSEWTNGIVEEVKSTYPKSEFLKLKWRE